MDSGICVINSDGKRTSTCTWCSTSDSTRNALINKAEVQLPAAQAQIASLTIQVERLQDKNKILEAENLGLKSANDDLSEKADVAGTYYKNTVKVLLDEITETLEEKVSAVVKQAFTENLLSVDSLADHSEAVLATLLDFEAYSESMVALIGDRFEKWLINMTSVSNQLLTCTKDQLSVNSNITECTTVLRKNITEMREISDAETEFVEYLGAKCDSLKSMANDFTRVVDLLTRNLALTERFDDKTKLTSFIVSTLKDVVSTSKDSIDIVQQVTKKEGL